MANPDRIDFTVLPDGGGVIVTKMRRDVDTDRGAPRDIPTSTETKPAGFDLEAALAWCAKNGYTVRQWPGGARAWKGEPWVIRTRHQIKRRRQWADRAIHRSHESTGSSLGLDFAYDG